MTTATLELNQDKVLRAQQQKKLKGRSAHVNMFSFDDYRAERRDASKAKMMERRMADDTNKAIDALINRWLDDAWAAGLNGIVIDPDNYSHGYQAISEVEKWLENTGRGQLIESPSGQPYPEFRLVLFPNKNQQKHAVLA